MALSSILRTDNALRVSRTRIYINTAQTQGCDSDANPSHPTTGKPVSHAFAKELLAGFAGAEVDKLAETKGEDFFDRERAKHEARKRAENLYDQHYGGQDQYDP